MNLTLLAANDAGLSLGAILDGLGDSIYAVDRRWRLTFFNAAAAEWFGLPESRAVGQVIWDAIPSLADTEYEAIFRRVMASRVREDFVTASVARPGRWIEIRTFPV